MNTKTKFVGHMLGLASLLMASQVNAATISLDPTVVDVNVSDSFMLTVQGSDFFPDTFGGGVTLTWDTNNVTLLSNVTDIEDSLGTDWFAFNSGDITIGMGTLTANLGNFFGAGPTFDLFALDFQALQSGPVTIAASSLSDLTSGWEDRTVDYVGATVNVNAVPVPAAVWLFGSGLIGLVGVSRRNKSKQV